MKKFIPLAFLCFIFLSASCSKDSSEEGNDKNAKELVIGKWEFTKIIYDNDGEEVWDDCEPLASFNFYNNGDVVRGFCNGGNGDGKYLVTGNTLELENEGLYSGTDRMRANIESISSEEMILDVEEGYLHAGAFTAYLQKAN